MRIDKDEGGIVLMPFTAEAVFAYHVLKEKGMNHVVFSDNRESIQGKRYDGCPIFSPREIAEIMEASTIIICSYKLFPVLHEQMKDLGTKKILSLDRLFIRDEERDVGFYVERFAMEDFRSIAPKQVARIYELYIEVGKYCLPGRALREDALILMHTEFVVTQRCTLKCRGCANLMQYYQEPRDITTETICEDIDVYMRSVDFVRFLCLIGGEPFVNKELHRVIDHIDAYKGRFGDLALVTNGTIIPSNEVLRSIKQAGLRVEISDYGHLSRNLDALEAILHDRSIVYNIRKVDTWYACQGIIAKNDHGQQTYDKCKASCTSVLGGKLYRCPFLANGEVLKAFPANGDNHVMLDAPSKIHAYLSSARAMPGCAYCSGYNFSIAEPIPVAEQLSEPIRYCVYE